MLTHINFKHKTVKLKLLQTFMYLNIIEMEESFYERLNMFRPKRDFEIVKFTPKLTPYKVYCKPYTRNTFVGYNSIKYDLFLIKHITNNNFSFVRIKGM